MLDRKKTASDPINNQIPCVARASVGSTLFLPEEGFGLSKSMGGAGWLAKVKFSVG
jgi:hypothetical protein